MQGRRIAFRVPTCFFGAHGLLLVAIPVLRYAFTQMLAILGAALRFLLVSMFCKFEAPFLKVLKKSWKFHSCAGGTKVGTWWRFCFRWKKKNIQTKTWRGRSGMDWRRTQVSLAGELSPKSISHLFSSGFCGPVRHNLETQIMPKGKVLEEIIPVYFM